MLKDIEIKLENSSYYLQEQDSNVVINAVECYLLAEQKATEYFKSLYQQVTEKSCVKKLIGDFQLWKHKHIHHQPFLSNLFGKNNVPGPRDYHRYIQWLDNTGKLENYLERSVSYIFMRDLGKEPSSPDTQTQILKVVEKLKDYLTSYTTSEQTDKSEIISIVGLYRKAQEEGIESSMIWVLEKLRAVNAHLPDEIEAEQAERKLIKIIFGVLMHEIEQMGDSILPQVRTHKLDKAIRLGYFYGLTYPFIDDLLDANVLSPDEKKRYSDLIRTTLVTGSIPELGEWTGKNGSLVQYIHSELCEAFEYIKANQRPETIKSFFEQAYVFFHSQEVDRMKELSDINYTNEELYIPVILKSSSSRLVARSVLGAPEDSGFDDRTFFYGIYNQLADDFADMFDDLKAGAVTPYTYYIEHHNKRPDLINPFELYWAVISNLIHNVYHSDAKTCEVILNRAVNGLKRFKERMGGEKYNEVMALFASGDPKFNNIIQKMVQKADDVDFFDKLLRDRMIIFLKNEKEEQRVFENTIKTVREQINGILNILKTKDSLLLDQTIVDAANYSLETDGKRVRPLIAWVMGMEVYGLDPKAMAPFLRSLEYMHTASLIFDDLPSQDNADIRRGCPTIHKVYNIAIAELAGLFLTQKAVEEQASLNQFDPKTVLLMIQYSACITQEICKGQAMDLNSKGKQLSLEQLNTLCLYKTGLAFEASLVMPAILSHVEAEEIEALKKFARHAGIAFQIKDDLLDAEGDMNLMGKPTGKDAVYEYSTFVTLLGVQGARKEMWNHYCDAMDILRDIPRNTVFLKQLLNYIMNRNH